MNKNLLTGILLSLALSFIVGKSYACGTKPTAKIVSPDDPHNICVGDSVSFDGEGSDSETPPTGSFDGDNLEPYGGGHGISAYDWTFGDGDSGTGGTTSHTYNTADTYTVTLEVTDDDDPSQTDTTTCTVHVIEVHDVEEDKTRACVDEDITFTANSFPSDKPLGCIEWQKRYKEKSTDPWGDWETASGGDNTAVLNTDTPGFYRYQARNGSHDLWKLSSVVTVIRAKIILTPEYVLVYTGDHAGEQPTRVAWARGDPKGGTFEWSYEKTGTGDIEFIEFVDLPSQSSSIQTAEIKGTAPSSDWYDVKLKVTYTLDGKSCPAPSTNLTVRRPKTTAATAGDCLQGGQNHYRKYYHVVSCQLDALLEDIGIPFEEVVTPEGSGTGPGATQYHEADNQGYGSWPGGIAVLDTLGCPANSEDAEFHQKLYGGGWLTTPEFNIYFQPAEEWPSIWKTTAP